MTSLRTQRLGAALELLLEASQQELSVAISLRKSDVDQARRSFESLKSISEEFGEKVRWVLSERGKRYNKLLPIHMLPDEILLSIFVLSLCEVSGKHYYWRLMDLSRVSSDWAKMVKNSPALWGLLDSALSAATQAQVLVMSKESPLEVVNDYPLAGFMARAVEVCHRWRAFEYRGMSFNIEEDLIALEGKLVPRLEELKINRGSPSCLKINLFGGKADRLRHVSLVGFSLPWDAAMLSGLRTLILVNLGTTAPSEKEVINMLCASPALVELTLRLFACERSGSTAQRGSIELPVLTAFTLHEIDVLTAHQLLTLIRIPKCTIFRVSLESTPIIELFSENSTAHLVPSIRRIMAAHPVVRVEIRSSEILILCRTAAMKNLEIRITEGTLTSELVARLVSLVDHPELSLELVITPMPDDIQLETILPMLTSSCVVKNLILESLSGYLVTAPEAVIQFLTEPVFEGGRWRWPLPNLQIFRLNGGSTNWGTFLRMINRRYGQVDGESNSQERPTPLHTLDLGTSVEVDAPYDLQLIEILGAGVIQWPDVGDPGFESEIESTGDIAEDSSGSDGSGVSEAELMDA
ncbi:hypothetical protein FRB96_003410 [Tulasnella sp. 330]|nr:hypothetical protein FRB96_003410 [Tulasnella sp. 330]